MIKMILMFCFLVALIYCLGSGKTHEYTHQEWDDKLKEDFKKYGPVPDDIDEDESN